MPGKIHDDDIDQIRGKANLVDLISQYTPLKKAGRSYKGLCPFHKEKTPSFTVDPAKQLFHCFGCKAGGDVFAFLMKVEGIDFPDAVEMLARRTGHIIRYEKSEAGKGQKGRLYELAELAAAYYEEQLKAVGVQNVREYLQRRGLSGDLISAFRLGYAPDGWHGLLDFLTKKGFGAPDMRKVGLVNQGQRGYYDYFRQRVMFPISDIQGRVIAFGGRVLDDGQPKYLNSPETPLYRKGSTLYGLFEAKQAIIAAGAVIVVEGYMDLLALRAVGIDHVVATLGTALTADHLHVLARFAPQVVLVFDGDSAGLAAAERGLEFVGEFRLPGEESLSELTQVAKVELMVAVVPGGEDPADFVGRAGAAGFTELLASARPLVDFCLDREIERHPIGQATGRIHAAQAAVRVIASLPGAVAREHYLRSVADRLSLSYESLAVDLAREAKRPQGAKTPVGREAAGGGDQRAVGGHRAERDMLRLVLQIPAKAVYLAELAPADWQNSRYRDLVSVLKECLVGKAVEIGDVLSQLAEDQQELATELIFDELTIEDADRFAAEMFLRLKQYSLDRQIHELRMRLDQSVKLDEQESDALFRELIGLEQERRALKDQLVGGMR